MENGILLNRDLTFKLNRLFLIACGVVSDVVNSYRDILTFCDYLLGVRLNLSKCGFNGVVLSLSDRELVLLIPQLHPCGVDRVEPQTDFKLLFLLGKNKEFLCLFALSFERSDTAFKLGENVPQTDKIFLRLIELAVCVVAAVSVMGNSCRFFKHISSLPRF